MPVYRIYRLRESQRERFRWAPHTSGVTHLKPGDYSEGGSFDGPSPYAAWRTLRQTDHPLSVGDVLEAPDGILRICKYVGFEEARWVLPEAPAGLDSTLVAAGPTGTPTR